MYISDPMETDEANNTSPSDAMDPSVQGQSSSVHLNPYEIAGIVTGSCLVILIMVGVTVLCKRKLKRYRQVSTISPIV